MSLERMGDKRIRVRDIREGGIIAKDGYIKVRISLPSPCIIILKKVMHFPLSSLVLKLWKWMANG